MRIILFLFLINFQGSLLFSQDYFHNEEKVPLTLAELQRQFNEWSDTKNLREEKYWKYFKRWEMDMLLHSAPSGEICKASDYIPAVINAVKEKNNLSGSKMPAPAWYPVGPDLIPPNLTGYMENGIGRINCIAFHPFISSTYYVGVAQGGLWKTANNGQSWIPLTDDLPITRISDIAIDPLNPDVIYISVCDFEYVGFGLYLNGRKRNTHYGLGVYKTIDGGLTWQASGLSFQLTDGDASLIRKVIVHPVNSNNLVACGVSGMYRSSDAGVSWSKNLDTLFWDLVPDPVNINTLYAASGWVKNANDGYAAIFKSTDFGNSWVELNTGIPPVDSIQRIKLAIAPSNNNTIYAVAVNTDNGLYGIYKTTNGGSNWQFINPALNILESNEGFGTGGQGTYDLAVLVNNTNENLVYVGGINLWGSSDGGLNFYPVSHWTTNYGPTVHADIHMLEQQPLTGNYFVCNDGGVYRTSNIVLGNWDDANNGIPWPTQWTNISDGLAITSFYRIASSKNSAGRIVAGAQDNATLYFDGVNWSTIFGGDGMDNYLDPVNDNVIVGSSQYGWFNLSEDNGVSNFTINPNMNNEVAEWTTPLVADYNQYGTLYAGFSNVSKTNDGGYSWSVISNFPAGFNNNEIVCLAVSPGNSNIIYAAKRVRYEYGIPGSVFKTTDGGLNWTDVTSGLPDSLYYTGLEISESDTAMVYVSMAGMSAGNKVFMTNDGGSTWENVSYNLPNLPVNCVKNIPGTKDIIIATDIGVYILYEDSLSWVNVSDGLPNVIISDIEFNTVLNKMYVCTFGRGIWASDLEPLKIQEWRKNNPAESFTIYPTVNNGTFTIYFDKENMKAELEIIDIKGRIISHDKITGKKNFLFIKSLMPGLYFAKVNGGNINAVKKFIVTN